MHRRTIWSLCKRLLPIPMVLVLIFNNSNETLRVSASEVTEQPENNENDIEEPDNSGSEEGTGEAGNEDGGAVTDNTGSAGDDTTPKTEEEPKLEGEQDPVEGQDPAITSGLPGEGVEGETLPEEGDGKPASRKLAKRDLFGVEENEEDDDEKESKYIVITPDINSEDNGFRITSVWDSEEVESKDEEDGAYIFRIEKDKDTAEITFEYRLDKYYELTGVSGGNYTLDAAEGKIVCTFENIETGRHEYTLSGTIKKTDEAAPAITEVKVAEGTPTYTSGEGTSAFSTDSSALSVSAVVKDEENGSGVDHVYVVLADGGEEDKQEMYLSGDDTYTWKPSHHGNYKVLKIEAEDDADNKSEADLGGKILCLYHDGEKPEASISEDDWFSTIKEKDKVYIEIEGETERKIDKIIISDVGEFAAKEDFEGRRYTIDQRIDLPDTEGVKKYTVSCKFCGDAADTEPVPLGEFTAKIDNSAPEAEIKTDYEEKTKHGHKSNEKYHSARDNVVFYMTVPMECDHESGGIEVSGLYKIYYTIKIEDEDGEYLDECSQDISDADVKDGNYVFSHEVRAKENDWVKYTLKVTGVEDAAGNKTDSVKSTESDVIVDQGGPIISYSVDGCVTSEGDMNFYSGELNGTVKITDQTLIKESIVFNDKDKRRDGYDYLTPVERKGYEDNDGEAVYDFSTSTDGEYLIYTQAADDVGNKSELESKIMILDNTEPEIDITYDKAGEISEDTFVNSNVGVTVTISDKWLNKNRSVVRVKKIDQNGSETEVGPISDWSGDLGDNEHKVSFTTDGDGVYKIYVEAYDMSGNHSSKDGAKFTVDATAPEVEISFDETDPVNGKYFNETRTATVKVTDFTFNEETAGLKIEEKYGSADVSGWTQTSGFTYTCTVTFERDGVYEISCESEDKAHNKSDKKSEPEFVIDKTAPEINVSYNGSEARNGNFYKDARIATVNIKEISFDKGGVKIETQPLSEVGALPSVGDFSSSDDNNVAHLTFDQDGTYGFTVNCTDLAGNTATNYISDVFIIDTTAPTVEFSGVENYSANNAEVAPSVVYGDKYIDIDASNVALRGANKGMVSVDNNIVAEESGFVVRYKDFAHDESMDDLYFLEANVYDKAGNASEDKLVFSVNRHGSVFIVGDGTKALNEKYYTNKPEDVSITEINIDELTRKDVSVSRDGDIRSLVSGRDFNVSKQGDDTSWKTYTYNVKSGNFNKDGMYSVTVFSQDRATNVQDNKTRNAEVSFAVDMSAPSIVTAGIEENTQYKETSHTFNVDVNDNMGVSSLVIYVDGKPVDTYDEERFDNTKDISVTLNESDERQTVTIIAEDVAGNKEINVYAGVLVSTKEISDPNVPGGTGVSGGGDTNPSHVTAQAIMFAIIAMGAIVAITGASILLYRRRVK